MPYFGLQERLVAHCIGYGLVALLAGLRGRRAPASRHVTFLAATLAMQAALSAVSAASSMGFDAVLVGALSALVAVNGPASRTETSPPRRRPWGLAAAAFGIAATLGALVFSSWHQQVGRFDPAQVPGHLEFTAFLILICGGAPAAIVLCLGGSETSASGGRQGGSNPPAGS